MGEVRVWASARCTLKQMNSSFSRIVAAVTSAVAVLMLAACSGGKDAVDQQAGGEFRYIQATSKGKVIALSDRKSAGPVKGELLNGGAYQLADDKGKVVVLNFWATWCAPCVTETPQLDALYRQRHDSGVNFVGLDVKDSRDAAKSFVEDKKITYPMVYDELAKTALQLGNIPIAGLPATVIIDKQGRVAGVYVGAVLPKDLTPALDKLSAES
jgi:thiol-disulfide isomerase/thioredoxin